MLMVRSTSTASEPSSPAIREKGTTGIKKGFSQLDKVYFAFFDDQSLLMGHMQAREKLNQDLEASGGDPE